MSDNVSLSCTNSLVTIMVIINHRNIPRGPRCLQLQLWSYERIAIGRPIIDHSPYDPDMYGDTEDDRPTMGTLWYAR